MTKSIKALGGTPYPHAFNHCLLCCSKPRSCNDEQPFENPACADTEQEVTA